MTSRWPLGAFVALGAATIAAFFLVQHLKVANPLINGFPAPFPSTIDPVAGGVCAVRGHRGRKEVSFRQMSISFYLQNQADRVNVYIVAPDGRRVRQIGDAVPMAIDKRHTFRWDGRLADGSVAPDGAYAVQVQLISQARTFEISDQGTGKVLPVTVDSTVPRPIVTGVSPHGIPVAGGRVTIRYTGVAVGDRAQRILIYRVRPGRTPVLAKSYSSGGRLGTSVWDGTIGGRPAPPGTYVIAVRATNAACTAGTSPATVAAAPRAVVTVG